MLSGRVQTLEQMGSCLPLWVWNPGVIFKPRRRVGPSRHISSPLYKNSSELRSDLMMPTSSRSLRIP